MYLRSILLGPHTPPREVSWHWGQSLFSSQFRSLSHGLSQANYRWDGKYAWLASEHLKIFTWKRVLVKIIDPNAINAYLILVLHTFSPVKYVCVIICTYVVYFLAHIILQKRSHDTEDSHFFHHSLDHCHRVFHKLILDEMESMLYDTLWLFINFTMGLSQAVSCGTVTSLVTNYMGNKTLVSCSFCLAR